MKTIRMTTLRSSRSIREAQLVGLLSWYTPTRCQILKSLSLRTFSTTNRDSSTVPSLTRQKKSSVFSKPGDNAAIVCEDFQLRTLAAELSPVRIRAMIEMYIRLSPDENRPIFLQMPSLAKSTVTDARLKQWKLYRPGEEHARDSLRHSITFLRRASVDVRIRRAAWPAIYGSRSL